MTNPSESRPTTVGELRDSGYQVLPVRAELRKNLIAKIETGEPVFSGIIGFDETVIPQIENAILAGQDIILLGERGQAKSRIIRHLVTLLDEEIPVIAGTETNDDPFAPISRHGKDLINECGDGTPVQWIGRDQRYGEKLATPDITVADLIGEIDPIKVAEGRYLSDELTLHFGIIPRTNRGIFAINELPDLSERIQVSLFNLMEERDVQIKGYAVRLPLDILIVASANPEDYTNRGRIITPLKDRYGAQIRTHYPRSIEDEITIVEQEYTRFEDMDGRVIVPEFMKEIVAEITQLARNSPDISQRSGVSLRMSISNYETLLGATLKRAIRHRESASPRISDLPSIVSSTTGKIELETVEEGREGKLIASLIDHAVLSIFEKHFAGGEFDGVLAKFDDGLIVDIGSDIPNFVYVEQLKGVSELAELIKRLSRSNEPAEIASATEFLLQGLHLNRKISREIIGHNIQYRG